MSERSDNAAATKWMSGLEMTPRQMKGMSKDLDPTEAESWPRRHVARQPSEISLGIKRFRP